MKTHILVKEDGAVVGRMLCIKRRWKVWRYNPAKMLWRLNHTAVMKSSVDMYARSWGLDNLGWMGLCDDCKYAYEAAE